MSRFDYLHEVETVTIQAEEPQSIAALLPLFKRLGFSLHDDVLSLDRSDRNPPWQHSSIVEVELLHNGEEVFDVEDYWDTMHIKYLFASLPYELAEKFVEVAFSISKSLSLPLIHRGEVVTSILLRQRFMSYKEEILAETGDEPGSESLAILIQSTYPRR
jgi:hypothetical protein